MTLIARYVATTFLLCLAVAQFWNLADFSRPTPTMTSRFQFNSQKCLLKTAAERTQEVARSIDDKAQSLLTLEDREIRVWVRSSKVGKRLFEAQGEALRASADCGSSDWCDGKASDDSYAPGQLPLVERRRHGENVVLAGCEISEADFHPLSFDVRPPPRRFDVLMAISLAVDIAVLIMLLWPALRWATERRRL